MTGIGNTLVLIVFLFGFFEPGNLSTRAAEYRQIEVILVAVITAMVMTAVYRGVELSVLAAGLAALTFVGLSIGYGVCYVIGRTAGLIVTAIARSLHRRAYIVGWRKQYFATWRRPPTMRRRQLRIVA
jgi:hypothetical protein